jgi:hypothetical protein
MVEHAINRHGFNIGIVDRMLFSSPFPNEVQVMDFPRAYKIPKCTKFLREIGESIVEHITRYTLEYGNLTSFEILKMKYFPSSLTRDSFSLFTTLTSNSVRLWVQFHDDFNRGELIIVVIDLTNIK